MHKKQLRTNGTLKRGTAFLLAAVLCLNQIPVLAESSETDTEYQTEYLSEWQTETLLDTCYSSETEQTDPVSDSESEETSMDETGTESVAETEEQITTEHVSENDTSESWNETEETPKTESVYVSSISAENSGTKLEATHYDSTLFPADVSIRLRTLEEMAEGEANVQEMVETYQTILMEYASSALLDRYFAVHTEADRSQWTEAELTKACTSSAQLICPMEYSMSCQDGSVYEAGFLNLSVHSIWNNIPEEQTERSVLFLTFDGMLRASCHSAVQMDTAARLLQIDLNGIAAPSYFSFVIFEEAQFQMMLNEELEQETTDEETMDSEVIYDSESESEAEFEPESQLESESESESEFESEFESETELLDSSHYAYDSVQQGTPCISSGTYTVVDVGEHLFSSDYTFIRGSSASEVQFWYDSSQVIKGVRESTDIYYLMPTSDAAKGNFGFRITNIAYSREEKCSLDLFVTVTDYENFSYDGTGTKVEGIYPYIGITKYLQICFLGYLPAFELSCDLVKTGTTERVKGNYRFMWMDIDSGQKYGINLKDGNIDAYYCVTGSEVNCGSETMFGNRYHMLYGMNDNTPDAEPKRSVMFEISNMSGFRILAKREGNVSASETLIRDRYADAMDGVFNATAGSVLAWNGTAYGPTELPDPLIKYVSNDGSTWKKSNVLDTTASEYWYMLELYVPQESASYYYSELTIEDILPKGVDYVGNFSAVIAETGSKTSGFTISSSKDTVEIDASALVGLSRFYGWTYQLKFKVKMDPTETTPSYHDNLAEYTVKNQATLTGKHKTDTSVTSNVSNKVTTKATELLTGRILITKTDADGNPLSGGIFTVKAAENICASDGTVLFDEGKKIASVTTGSDGTAVVEGCYPGMYTVTETKPPAGYVLNSTAQKVTVPDADSKGVIADTAVVCKNNQTCIILKKISAPEEGSEETILVSGASFRIWSASDQSDAKTYTTNKNGLITIYGLIPGTYYYQETKAAAGYLLDDTVRSFTIDSKGLCEGEKKHQLICENEYIELQISKTDKASGAAVPGAVLQLTNENSEVIDTWTSEAAPHVIRRIPAGTYTLTELEAPSGYKKSSPLNITVKESAEIQYASLTNTKLVEICLTKTIQAEDIVWAHGNPIFTFCVEGTDLDGESHCWYETVEFEKQSAADSGLVSLSAYFEVPAGSYRAYETNVIRYKLAAIESVQNGTAAGVGVNFTLEKNESGSAVFVNRKNNDEGLTDTDYVKNVIIP